MRSYPKGTFAYTVMPYDTLEAIADRYNTSVPAITSINSGVNLGYLRVGQNIAVCQGYSRNYPQSPPPGTTSKAEEDLKDNLSMLWEQHVTWTRLTLISMVFGLPDEDIVTTRLLRNPGDFAKVLAPLYGEQIASAFSDLLKSHLVIAAQLVKAAKAGDNNTAASAEKRWYENADEMAAFLARINPYWSEAEWQKMLHEHLALTKLEAIDLLTKNYPESITLYDEIERQAMMMADLMARGIVNQYPGKYRQS
jgi:hypothetical protein